MPEMSNRPPSQKKPESIDVSTLKDQIVFGLDPAVHWVHVDGQHEQFPWIVPQIRENWDDVAWLTKLIERAGFNTQIYDSEKNPRGILLRIPHKQGDASDGIRYIRYFALRMAGVTVAVCATMFKVGSGLKYERIVPKPVEQGLVPLREKLKSEAKE